MEYCKLIRDFIPDIISASGRRCETRVLGEQAYQDALREKLVEEALEVKSAPLAELAIELADVLEVIAALATAHGIRMEEIQQLQAARRQERGGFQAQLQLLKIHEEKPQQPTHTPSKSNQHEH
ncbi:nucleoside triphosphate pyrophosphohydrolase [Hymenobacter jeollabukensis]|uniref:Phosphoribosyl-ATP pyrophosphohydrolase n=1 Tax=Hymenobacter jeollabukensis TaxID=2025313 RepID=A0A5R8WJ98_9BACT|nr:nucleoside triphosphate pyrophosphohydrolase [Hymenobacter jeollabukensis]TLM88975.1 hypothetical protein FDY95_22600 [Hymenobacter jeollabukensis]